MSPTTGYALSSNNFGTAVAERPIEILQRLTLVPGTDEALALFRSEEGGAEAPSSALIESLRGIRQRLLAEASPDFWIQEFALESGEVDSHQIDLAVDVAAVRLGEATAISGIIDDLENSALGNSQVAPSFQSEGLETSH